MRTAAYMTTPEAARFFAVAADETRLRILSTLQAVPNLELCVCELVDVLREPQYNVSRHLRILAAAGLVAERREGRWTYYHLSQARREVRALLRAARGLNVELDPPSRRRLVRRLGLRHGGVCVVGVRDPALLSRRRPRG